MNFTNRNLYYLVLENKVMMLNNRIVDEVLLWHAFIKKSGHVVSGRSPNYDTETISVSASSYVSKTNVF